MGHKYLILVCNSRMPKQQNNGCCKDRKGDEIIDRLTSRIEELGLTEEVHVKHSGCLSNCSMGVSVKVFPGSYLYGKVTETDIEEIIEEHLVMGHPLGRLLVPAKNFPGL